MNKSIWLSILSIFAVVALVGGLTWAYFSDVGTSSANVFNSGTLDMKLTDSSEGPSDSVSGTWGLASAPGDTFSGDLNIKNSGSVVATHIELKFDNVVTNAGSGPGTVSTIAMDRVIEITNLSWDLDGNGSTDTDLLALVTDLNLNGIKDLDDLENRNVNGANDFDDVTFGGVQSDNHKLHMEGRLSPTLAVNQHQGDSVTMSLTVDMNQDSTQ